MNKNVIYLVLGLNFIACRQLVTIDDIYPKDTTISKVNGIHKDSLSFYYPYFVQDETQKIKTGIDTLKLNWFSSSLYSAHEPILYNFYLGRDIYRFLWLRSFDKPVVFSLRKERKNVLLTTKVLDKHPEFLDEYSPINFAVPKLLPNGQYDTTQTDIDNGFKKKIIKKAERRANIILNKTIKLTVEDWNEFESLLNSYSFWTAKPYTGDFGIDGSEWTIEGHRKFKYWFVTRHSPTDKFKNCGEYLINKNGLKEEIY